MSHNDIQNITNKSRALEGVKPNGKEIRTPRVNLYETDAFYHLSLSIPGVKKENFNLSFKSNRELVIKGIVYSDPPTELKTIISEEIYQGRFERTITFPGKIERNDLSFDYQGGILRVTIKRLL